MLFIFFLLNEIKRKRFHYKKEQIKKIFNEKWDIGENVIKDECNVTCNIR